MCCCCCYCVIAATAAAVDDDVDGSGNRVGTVRKLLQRLHTFKRVNIHAQFCALMQCSNNDARGNLLKGGRKRGRGQPVGSAFGSLFLMTRRHCLSLP